MAQIGNTSGGFIVDDGGAEGLVVANKYTAASTFTPTQIVVGFVDAFGNAGTIYVGVYSDSAGSPGTLLFSGSAAFASSFNGEKTISVTGTELTSATDYWLAAYVYVGAGTHNIDYDARNSPVNQEVKTWTEGVEGSWTNTPTIGTRATDREILLYAEDAPTTSTSTSTSTSTTSTTSSTSTTSTSRTTSTSTSTTTTSTSRTTSTSTTVSITTSTSTTSTSTSTTTTSTSTSRTTSTSSSTTNTSSSTSVTTTSTTITLPYRFSVQTPTQGDIV